jgi:glycine cleavage system aminomethyltransferase T
VDGAGVDDPPLGAVILADDREIGRVTSAAVSPRPGRYIALGYVTRSTAEPGRRVQLAFRGQTLPAAITALAG